MWRRRGDGGGQGDAPSLEVVRNACRAGNTADLRRWLTRDTVNDWSDGYAYGPLHWASRAGQLEVVRFLLSIGADVHASNSLGFAPLAFAAWSAHPPVLKELLNAGARVESRDNTGCSALHRCASTSSVCVQLLLRAGADVNALDNAGSTLILRALQAQSKVCVCVCVCERLTVSQVGFASMVALLDANADLRLLPANYTPPPALTVYVARRAATVVLALRRFKRCTAMRDNDVHIIIQIAKLIYSTRDDVNVWVRRLPPNAN